VDKKQGSGEMGWWRKVAAMNAHGCQEAGMGLRGRGEMTVERLRRLGCGS
jgi:hypothetical protein